MTSVKVALFLALLLPGAPALAQSAPTHPTPDWETPKTTSQLAHDLNSTAGGKRSFAARELKRQIRNAYKASRKTRGDELQREEAVMAMADFREFVHVGAARAVIEQRAIRGLCASILGYLEIPETAGALRRAREAEDRKGVLKKIDAALAAIGEGP